MSGKENIIANILSGAEAEKEELLRAATDKAEEISRADDEYIAALKAETEQKCAREETLTVERFESVAALDVKKRLLQAKQDKIAEVYERAEAAFAAMDDQKYNDFLCSLLEKYAEKGDTIVFSAKEEGRVAVACERAKKEGYAVRFDGAFSGGILFEGKNYDKNATVPALVREYGETHGRLVAEILEGV